MKRMIAITLAIILAAPLPGCNPASPIDTTTNPPTEQASGLTTVPTTEPITETPTKPTTEAEAETIPKLNISSEHICSYEATVIAPTCSAAGYTHHVCSCGKSYKDNETVAIGHLYGSWTVIVHPTASTPGTKQCVCSRCGHVNFETVPKLDAETAEKYEHYIDPRIQIITTGDGYVWYFYSPVSVIDSRTWGDPPTIRISGDGGFQITYYDKSDNEIYVTLSPVDGYIHRCAILEDGSYVLGLTGDYMD